MIDADKYYDALQTIECIDYGMQGFVGYTFAPSDFENSKYCKQCFINDFQIIKDSASKNDADALFFLGICYEQGWGVDKDEKESIKYFLQSADLENPAAQYKMSIILAEGRNVPQNAEESILMLKKSANKGLVDAQFRLATLYQIGFDSFTCDDTDMMSYIDSYEMLNDNALAWFTKAAEQDEQASQWILGHHFELIKQFEKSTMWYQKSAANNNAIALYQLGRHYQYGIGTEVNIGKAKDCYKKAIELEPEDTQSYTPLFLIYYDLKKYNRANEIFQQLIENETEEMHSSELDTKYGLMCAKGLGLEENPNEAINLLSSGLCTGYDDDEAYKILSQYYIKYGKRIKLISANRNVDEVINAFESKAQEGNPDMQYRLALIYKNGEIVKKNRERAKYWFKKSADQGNILSQKEYYKLSKTFIARLFS